MYINLPPRSLQKVESQKKKKKVESQSSGDEWYEDDKAAWAHGKKYIFNSCDDRLSYYGPIFTDRSLSRFAYPWHPVFC